MWGEIKFWANRYSKWILVGLGLVGLTLVFLLFSQFSASEDRQMKEQVKQVEQTQEVIEEQRQDVVGDKDVADAVKQLPTDSELIAFLDTHREALGEDVYTTDEAYSLIEEEFGKPTSLLAEQGYILSEGMTADQRLIIQLYQEQVLFSHGEINEEDLVSLTLDGSGSVGIPKTIYNARKYLGQRLTVNSYKYGIFNEAEYEADDYNIFSHDTSTGEINVGYDIPDSYKFGDVTLVGGYVAKGQNATSGEKSIYTYLVFKPNKTMTGKEYLDTIKELDIQINKSQPSERVDGDELLDESKNVYPVQIIDSLHFYGEEDGYNENDEVTLSIDGELIDLVVSGTSFESAIRDK